MCACEIERVCERERGVVRDREGESVKGCE